MAGAKQKISFDKMQNNVRQSIQEIIQHLVERLF